MSEALVAVEGNETTEPRCRMTGVASLGGREGGLGL